MYKRVFVMCLVLCLSLVFVPKGVIGAPGAIEATLPEPVYKGAEIISFTSNQQAAPTLIYNSNRDEYLAVWSEEITSGYYDLAFARYDAGSKKVISNPQKLLTNGYNNTFVTGAYVATADRYMLVWQQNNPSTPGYDNLLGMVIDYQGAKVVQPFWIASSATNQATKPTVAYDPNTNNFMAAWINRAPGYAGYGIAAQLIPLSNPSSIDATSWMTVAYDAGEHTRAYPDITWDAYNDQFVIVYQYAYSATDRDIRAAFYKGDGTLLSVDTIVSQALSDELQPSIASCAGSDSIFVAWEDQGTSSSKIIGQFFSGAHPPQYTPHNLEIYDHSGFEVFFPEIACNYSGNAYIVSWWQRDPATGMEALAKLYQPDYDASDAFYVAKSCFDTNTYPNAPVNIDGGKSSFGFAWEFQNSLYSTLNLGYAQVSPYAVFMPLSLRTP